MTLQEHIKDKGLIRKRICEHISISFSTLKKYEATNRLDSLTVNQAIKLCDFIGLDKNDFMKGNIKPSRGSRR